MEVTAAVQKLVSASTIHIGGKNVCVVHYNIGIKITGNFALVFAGIVR